MIGDPIAGVADNGSDSFVGVFSDQNTIFPTIIGNNRIGEPQLAVNTDSAAPTGCRIVRDGGVGELEHTSHMNSAAVQLGSIAVEYTVLYSGSGATSDKDSSAAFHSSILLKRAALHN